MTDDSTPKDPKIIVDEDWKSQVQAEKEAGTRPDQPGTTAESPEPPVPEATFAFLVTTLATQAMMALAQAEAKVDDAEVSPQTSRAIAKHHIDTLGILQQKTKGNLTGDELVQINNVLHQLRMTYLNSGPPSD